MATRSGSIDPAVLPIRREHGLSLRRLRELSEHAAGPIALGGLDDESGFGVYTHRIAVNAEMAMASEDWTSSRSSAVSARTGTTSELRSPSGSRLLGEFASRWFRRGRSVIADEVRACSNSSQRKLNRRCSRGRCCSSA